MGQIEIKHRAKNYDQRFENLDVGEVFEHEGSVFIKTSNRDVQDSGENNAFDLTNYHPTYFLLPMIVTPRKATLVIE